MSLSIVAQPGNNINSRRKKSLSLYEYNQNNSWGGSVDSFNMIHQVYRGRYDRLERYKIYDWMDDDSDISRALDLIAEHCSDRDANDDIFQFKWNYNEPTDEESHIITENLNHWIKINRWDDRLFRSVRNVLKYGDWFYFRDPDTFELYSIHPKFIIGALVDRTKLEVKGWIVRNFKFNVANLELSVDNKDMREVMSTYSNNAAGYRSTKVIPAIHMMHVSLSEGRFSGSNTDDNPTDRHANRWPFGESWLENAYKTFKQRELLEDAVLIHRVQRAPSRIVWYIDTGKMRADRASWTVNNFKNELNQKRIPQFINRVNKTVDSVYDPISQLEDIYIPVSFEQRGSKVEALEGQPWENLPDIEYFNKKMMKSLRVPYSWMVGSQEGGAVFNDVKAGVAYQEEVDFSRFCSRIQRTIDPSFDFEFKLYCMIRDININSSDFDLKFNPPTNFLAFRQRARDQENIGVFSSIKDLPWISQRFAAKRYLDWTDDEIVENERMKLEEIGKPTEGIPNGGYQGGMGALPPSMGSPDMGPSGLGMGPMGNQNAPTGSDFGGGLGGSPAQGDLGGAAAGLSGGMGEAKMNNKNKKIIKEVSLTSNDIKPVSTKKTSSSYFDITPNDKLTLNKSTIDTDAPLTKLSMIRKIRLSHLSRRIENEKRRKVISIIYKPPVESGPGGLGM